MVSQLLADCNLWFEQNDEIALGRLESFVADIPRERIEREYLELAELFCQLPSGLAVRLAHSVIENYLDETRWVEVYLWAFSASRLVPVEDTHWNSRNYMALALQALGEREEAHRLLLESWQAMKNGSGTAYFWIFGRDPSQSPVARVTAELQGREADPNPFEAVSAPWLDLNLVAETTRGILSQSTFSKEGAKQVDAEGLLPHLLRALERGATKSRNGGIEGARQTTLLGMFRAFFEKLELGDGAGRLEVARKIRETTPGEVALIWDNYSLAVLAGYHGAYVEAAEFLLQLDCQESAEGLARVAVWRDISGAARSLAQIVGIDPDKLVLEGDIEPSQEMLFQIYQMAGT